MFSSDYKDPEYEYVVFIDESGDPGLSKVKPIDEKGSSEWLIVAAIVTSKRYEVDVDDWVAMSRRGFGIVSRSTCILRISIPRTN
jgi:hypothetical protein